MLNIINHRLILFNLIRDIYQSAVGDILGFKGGTMAYFFYGLDRFSVDLDFDLLNEKKINLIKNNLSPIIKKYGEIIEERNKFFTYFYLLSYEKKQRHVKIEISKRDILSSYEISNFYGVDVKIQKIEDAFATKLLACTTRKTTAYRDYYDVLFYLKKGVMPNEKIIYKITKKSLPSYLKDLKKRIADNLTGQKVIEGIGELINQNQKEYIRKKFKDELISNLSFFIDNLSSLNKNA